MKPIVKASPYTCPGAIDLSKIQDKLRKLETDDKQGYCREKPGLLAVIDELPDAIAKYSEPAKIHMGIYLGFLEKTEIINNIRAIKPVVAKLHEALEESELFYEDAREADIARIAKDVLDAVAQCPDILAAFEDTLKYRSQYAEKAVATRRKNEEEAQANTLKAAKTRSSKARTRKPKASKPVDPEPSDKPQSPV
jgi:hypothetical protein